MRIKVADAMLEVEGSLSFCRWAAHQFLVLYSDHVRDRARTYQRLADKTLAVGQLRWERLRQQAGQQLAKIPRV